MRVIAIKYAIVFLLVIGSGGLLMNISQHVQRAQREIKIYDKKIVNIEENIRVLNAEWAYLNNPLRLEMLSSKGLYLIPPKSEDLISDLHKSFNYDASSKIIYPPRSPLHRDISYVQNSSSIPYPYKNHNSPLIANHGGAQ